MFQINLSFLLIFSVMLNICSIVDCITCKNGIPILTRQKLNLLTPNDTLKYQLKFRCLCPNDYYGFQCQTSKKLHCITHSSQRSFSLQFQDQNNQNKLKFQFTLKCFIQIPQIQITKTSQQQQQKPKVIRIQQFVSNMKTQKHSNIYGINNNQEEQVKEKFEILWINDTKQFTKDGIIKSDLNMSEDDILQNYKQYTFQYKYKGYRTNDRIGFETHAVKLSHKNSPYVQVNAVESKIKKRILITFSQFYDLIMKNKPSQGDIRNIQSFDLKPPTFQFEQFISEEFKQNNIVRLQLFVFQIKSAKKEIISLNAAEWKIYVGDNNQYIQRTLKGYTLFTKIISIIGLVIVLSIIAYLCCYRIRKEFNPKKLVEEDILEDND